MANKYQLQRALAKAHEREDTKNAKILAKAIAEGNYTDVDISATELISNILPSAGQAIADITFPFRSVDNAVDTAHGIQSMGQGLFEKAVSGAYSLAGGNSDEINGIHFGQTENEEVVDAVGDYYGNRYGSWNGIKNTLEQDPAGAWLDATGILTLGGTTAAKTAQKTSQIAGDIAKSNTGLLGQVANKTRVVADKVAPVANTVAQASKAVDPINIAANAVVSTGGRLFSKDTPIDMIQEVMKFPTSKKVTPAMHVNMAKTMLENDISPSMKGVGKIFDGIKEGSIKLEKLLDAATESGAKVPIKEINQHITELIKELNSVTNINAAADVGDIVKELQRLRKHYKSFDTEYLTPNQVQALKKDLYKKLSNQYEPNRRALPTSVDQLLQTKARGAKHAVERVIPEAVDINRDIGNLIELRDNGFLSGTNRINNRNFIGLDPLAKIGSGTMLLGPLGTGLGFVASVAGRPAIKARMAQTLFNIQNRGLLDHFNGVSNSTLGTLSRQGMRETGREGEEERQRRLRKRLIYAP
ncbi:MAG TPA: hypothetical protein EYQ26_09675 [Rhodospirillales bacterium]|nr:hypothetical protein [Rhodospirillales bacterium]